MDGAARWIIANFRQCKPLGSLPAALVFGQEFPGDTFELAMHILPLPHPDERKVISSTPAPERGTPLLRLGLPPGPPQSEEGKEVASGISKCRMCEICGTPARHRSLSRILYRQRRDDRQDFGKAGFLNGRQYHAAEPWIDGYRGQSPPDIGEVAVSFHGADLPKRLVAIPNQLCRRPFEKREGVRCAKPERRHLKDHTREIRSENLWRGVLGTLGKLLRVTESNTKAGGDPAAPPAPLIRR